MSFSIHHFGSIHIHFILTLSQRERKLWRRYESSKIWTSKRARYALALNFFFLLSVTTMSSWKMHGDELLNEIAGKIERKPPEVPAAADRNMDPLHEGLAK
jgi:hypothetical protein